MKPTKTILITGGTSGIGRATALGLAESGFNVAICGRRQGLLDEITAEAPSKNFVGIACDVTDPDSVANLFAKTTEAFGRVDVVFNNAGRFSPPAIIADLDIDTWQDMVDVNLNGAFYVARQAFKTMRDQTPQGGRIINNGSISAHTPRPHGVAYNATKHAISGLTKSVSLDGRPFGISCGQIDIGNTATDMTAPMSKGMMQADGSAKPEPRFDVRHVVDAVRYMAELPPEANVQTITVMATNMPYVGRG